MPNIFKSFLRPAVSSYVFPQAEELVVEEEPVEEPAPLPPEEGEEKAEAVPQEEREPDAISFAQVQAQEILADARRQAEEILAQARAQGEEEARQAREEAHDEGYRQGYGEGLSQARVEARQQQEQWQQEQGEQIRQCLEKVSLAREELIHQTRGELCDLTIAIAEKIIHISLKSSREVIERMIQGATEKLKRREWVHIYVSGGDIKTLAQISPELMSSLAVISDHIKIIPMADDEPGTCIVEMPDEIIDASVSTQLSNIREILAEG